MACFAARAILDCLLFRSGTSNLYPQLRSECRRSVLRVAGDIAAISLLSLFVSGTSTLLATLIAVPLGVTLGLREIGSQRFLRTILFTLYGLPPVLAGLLVFLLLSRGGPLGALGLLFTPLGMVLAQVVVVTPIVLGITM